MKIKTILLVLIAIGALAASVVVIARRQDSTNQQSQGQNQSPTNSSTTSETEPTYSGSKTNNSEDLEECLRRANNSEAHQGIIDEAVQACYDKYR